MQDARPRLWQPMPNFPDLAALNAWLERRCLELWREIPHGRLAGSLADVWAEEQPALMPVPPAFDGFVEQSKRVSPTCLISFERNRYSVPVYSDAAIQACLTVKVLFGLPLRQATGFVASLLKLAGLDWPVPDCSTLCRRQKTRAVQLPYRGSGGPLHLRVDSTGIKVRGARVSGTRASTAGPGGASGARCTWR